MENRGNYLGKDGKYYKTTAEWTRANAVVEEQQKQTRVLEQQAREQQRQNAESQRIARQMSEATKQQNEEIRKQNEIAMLQAVQEQMKMKQEKQLEYDRQEHERNLEQARHEHEKELLLLKIFDEVSIPLGVYQKFESNLLNGGYVKPEDKERYVKLINCATEILNKKMESGEKFEELLKSNMNYPNNEVRYTDKYKKLEQFINDRFSTIMLEMDVKDFDIISDNKELVEVFINEQRGVKFSKKVFSFIGMFEILAGTGMAIGGIIYSSMRILLFSVAGFCIFSGINFRKANQMDSKVTQDLKQKLNEAINSQMANEYSQDNISEEEKSINEEMKKLQAEINESSKVIIDQRLQDLYNFRLEHYNLKIEKLFYDVGLVNKCIENNYNWLDIDKKNIKSEGTYEDYFHYFNNYNPENEEQQ